MTSHWRSFIRPLMWRCKWTELRIKEIESQALKYARELSAYDQRKFSGIDQSTVEGCGSKSFPFSSQCYRKKAIKRRRRKRIEETTDITSYMSCHNLFSYLGMSIFFILDHCGLGVFLLSLTLMLMCDLLGNILQKTRKQFQMALILLMILSTQVIILPFNDSIFAS